jgi:uncharacterized membrane protein YtjA (UPF0391 family)
LAAALPVRAYPLHSRAWRYKMAAPIAHPHDDRQSNRQRRSSAVLKWAIIFAIISLLTGWLGFSGLSGFTAMIAKILFFIFLILLVLAILALIGILHLF